MKRVLPAATAACVLLLLTMPPASAVQIHEQDERFHVRGQAYEAVIDGAGNFRSLRVEGVEFLATGEVRKQPHVGGGFPGEQPAQTVSREGRAITASREDISVRYIFDDQGFTLDSKGGAVRWLLSEHVTACIAQKTVIPRGGVTGDVHRIVAGEAAIAVDQPHHVVRGSAFPSMLTRGGKAKEPFKVRWTCGVEVSPEELVDLTRLKPAGRDHRVTAEYDPGQSPQMTVQLTSYAASVAKPRLTWRVVDHPHNGQQVAAGERAVELAGGASTEVSFEVPVEAPGLYWVHAGLHRDGQAESAEQASKPMQSATRGFIYDRDNYKPALTRPEDFKDFWDARLEAMRERPFDPEVTENPDLAIDGYKGYDLQITGHDGQRLACVLIVPDRPGPHDAEVGGYSDSAEKVRAQLRKSSKQPKGVGMWQRGDPRLSVGAAIPEQSTYRRWDGRDDNNMLDSYLQKVRLLDYLRSRDDVRHIWLFGASRTGASTLAAAALAPEQVVAVNVHVPTSCGLSRAKRPYRGWGNPPSRDAGGLKTAAYFDPVNFAPDLEVPLVMDAGIYDGLSPAPGILAFYNHATHAPFSRCAIEQGHHGYFEAGHRDEMEAALAEHLKARGIDPAAAPE